MLKEFYISLGVITLFMLYILYFSWFSRSPDRAILAFWCGRLLMVPILVIRVHLGFFNEPVFLESFDISSASYGSMKKCLSWISVGFFAVKIISYCLFYRNILCLICWLCFYIKLLKSDDATSDMSDNIFERFEF